MKDKKAFIFYFLMSIVFLDFGNQLRKISFNPFLDNYSNSMFSIVHLNNTGSAFSLFQNHTKMLAIFGILAVILLSFYVIKEITFNDKILLLAITLFNAGTLGNLIERIQYGYVMDYIKLNFVDFPVFNAFDVMICLGVFIYAIYIMLDIKKEINERKLQNNSNK